MTVKSALFLVRTGEKLLKIHFKNARSTITLGLTQLVAISYAVCGVKRIAASVVMELLNAERYTRILLTN